MPCDAPAYSARSVALLGYRCACSGTYTGHFEVELLFGQDSQAHRDMKPLSAWTPRLKVR